MQHSWRRKRISSKNEEVLLWEWASSTFVWKKMFGRLLVQHLPPYTEKLSPPLPSWEKQNGRSSRSDETAASTLKASTLIVTFCNPTPTPSSSVVFNGQLAESFPALVTIKSETLSDGNTIWNALGRSSAPWTRESFDFENLRAPAALPDWKIPCDGGGGQTCELIRKLLRRFVLIWAHKGESQKKIPLFNVQFNHTSASQRVWREFVSYEMNVHFSTKRASPLWLQDFVTISEKQLQQTKTSDIFYFDSLKETGK